MTRSEARVVTGLMLGTFLAFGVDTLVVVAALWYVGRLSGAVAGAVAWAVLLVFALWVVVRWVRLRSRGDSAADRGDGAAETGQPDPLDGLKRRYANGELSEAEFERRLDALLDADRRAESTTRAAEGRPERAGESE